MLQDEELGSDSSDEDYKPGGRSFVIVLNFCSLVLSYVVHILQTQCCGTDLDFFNAQYLTLAIN